MIDVNKLEQLPTRMSRKEYLTKKYRDMWNLKRFDSYDRSKKEDQYFFHLNNILKSHIGKSVDDAFSKYCEKVDIQDQKYFFKEFNEEKQYYSDYIIDDNKNIQLNSNGWKRKKNRVIFRSFDIKYGWYDIRAKIIVNAGWRCVSEEYIRCIIQGYEKIFESKKDPEYKRLMAEKVKLQRLDKKQKRKERRRQQYSFLTKREIALKNDKEDILKRDRKGFDEESFKGLEYHGQKRKRKSK